MSRNSNKISINSGADDPTKVMVVANQKGGVGKTTVLVNCVRLAALFCTKPTLLIELCPQGNASQHLYGVDYEEVESLKAYQLFTNDLSGEPLNPSKNIEIIPASDELSDIEGAALDLVIENFVPNVRALAESGLYSWIFIDTPPSLGRLQLAGIAAADSVFIPVALNGFSIKGLQKMVTTIVGVREELNPSLDILGILPNQVNFSSSQQVKALEEIQEKFGDLVITPPLRMRSPIMDATDNNHAVWENCTSGNARTAAKEVKAAVINILSRACLQ